jgi:hypothetical protein
MPLFSYFIVVGTILLGIIILSGIASGPPPPLWFSHGSQGLPSNQALKNPNARDLSPTAMAASIIPQAIMPSEALASDKLANREMMNGKHKAKAQ